ncbi:type II toxin-antitoxin system PemK/MazF family toxin [Calothrix sp. NIES-3974]|uniref:type II toxin-antitoxin system PemK/MazF family toxin n=1 Tax=Calothrix sp. NIES-3974 TaxID=2005462 RepID=UPI000BBBDFAE|nr:type II toxin-antitoxin system PemK/MazF family toxin [Calothrix sp. NIES-3974]
MTGRGLDFSLSVGTKQGEIWLVNFDPTIGAEIKKTRPANQYLCGKANILMRGR